MECLLAYEDYALECEYIGEIHSLRELTPSPKTPPFAPVLVNVRGPILSLLDLRRFFDLPEKGLTDPDKVIVVRSSSLEVGILADAILGVRSVALQELQRWFRPRRASAGSV